MTPSYQTVGTQGITGPFTLQGLGSLIYSFFYVNIYLVWGIFVFLIYVFLAALGLCGCARTFSSCGEQGLL